MRIMILIVILTGVVILFSGCGDDKPSGLSSAREAEIVAGSPITKKDYNEMLEANQPDQYYDADLTGTDPRHVAELREFVESE